MKLLIVDDEKLTRDGLMSNIDWKSLGIDAIAQADDGLHGYEAALAFQPDIILSDVRMPRMSGIEMAEKLQLVNPALSIIFMSGYSDKEYLKAAIKLKAVSYVEKPIDLEEVEQALRDVIRDIQNRTVRRMSESCFSMGSAGRIRPLAAKFSNTARRSLTRFPIL